MPININNEFKSMMDFMEEKIHENQNKICLIKFSDKFEESDVDSESVYGEKFLEHFRYAKKIVIDNYSEKSFNFYRYNASILFIVGNGSMEDSEFIETARFLYDCCMKNKDVISDFAITLTGIKIYDLLERISDLKRLPNQNKFVICDMDVTDGNALLREFEMVSQINAIIKANKIVPYFQGIYDNTNNHFFAYETLMRLQCSDGKILFPNDFIHVSKKYNLYLHLSRIMILNVLEMFGDRNETITLNISMLDILSPHFNKDIFEKLASIKKPENFIFELLETERIEDYEILKEFIHNAKKFGVKFAVDDFGSGYSNFIEIGNLDIDYIKINGSLTELLGTDVSYDKILESIFYLSKKMQVELIAECVETAAMQKRIVTAGIRYSQGYFFSKPMSIEELNIVSEKNQILQSEQKTIAKEEKNDNEVYHNFFKDKKSLEIQKFKLRFGGLAAIIITIVAVLLFADFNRNQIQLMNNAFLNELSENFAQDVTTTIEDSENLLTAIGDTIYRNELSQEEALNTIKAFSNNTKFDEIYISFEDNQVLDFEGDLIELDVDSIENYKIDDELTITSPLVESGSQRKVFFIVTNIMFEGTYKGRLYGKYYIDEFSSILSLESFNGDAFFNLCEIDGTPLILSANRNNVFTNGDFYEFIGNVNTESAYDVDEFRKDLENGESIFLDYSTNGETKTAVATMVDRTPWVLTTVLPDSALPITSKEVANNILQISLFIATVFAIYFGITIYTTKRNQDELFKTLEKSYSLSNSLQTTIETDVLTKTYNRSSAIEKIKDAINIAVDRKMAHAIVVLNVNKFKQINEVYGSEIGDIYLQELVSAVKSKLRNGDVIGRLGGDEFIFLLNNIQNKNNVEFTMRRVFDGIKQIKIQDASLEQVSVSAGVCMIPSEGDDYEELMKFANIALKDSKKEGGFTFSFYEGGESVLVKIDDKKDIA